MSYRIAGIDVHKKMLAVVVSDVESTASISLSGGGLPPTPNNCGRSPHGCSSKRPWKS